MAGVGAGIGRLLVVVLLTTNVLLLLLLQDVDGCYLRNCPIGGKRRSINDAVATWIDRLHLQTHNVSALTISEMRAGASFFLPGNDSLYVHTHAAAAKEMDI